jgi:arsenate reductase (thioredoxin)
MIKRNVLFLCTGNSARSLMAEALLRDRAGDLFEVYSAGTDPRGVQPLTSRVLREIGVDVERVRSKSVNEYLGRIPFAFTIVVCAAADRTCPAEGKWLGERHFWRIEDPTKCEDTDDDPLDRFREARDELDERIADWLSELRVQNLIPALVV